MNIRRHTCTVILRPRLPYASGRVASNHHIMYAGLSFFLNVYIRHFYFSSSSRRRYSRPIRRRYYPHPYVGLLDTPCSRAHSWRPLSAPVRGFVFMTHRVFSKLTFPLLVDCNRMLPPRAPTISATEEHSEKKPVHVR